MLHAVSWRKPAAPINTAFPCGAHQPRGWFFLITKERKKTPQKTNQKLHQERIDLVFGLIILRNREKSYFACQ